MRYKLLGRSGLRVSEICLGAMGFGEARGGADERAARAIVDAFAAAGGNFLDTANAYQDGQSEAYVGRAVAGDRDRWVVATKYTLATRPDDPNAAGNSRKNLARSVEASLRRFGTDYVDLLYVHAWDFTTPADEVLRGLDDLVRAGKVLYVGASDAPAWVVAGAAVAAGLRGWAPFVALQTQYSLVERTAERELLPMAEHHGLGVAAWAPLGGGLLAGKFTRGGGAPVDGRRAASNGARPAERDLRIAREVDAVADELGAASSQVATAWLRQRGPSVVPVVGARRAEQLREVLGGLDLRLGAEHRRRLDAASHVELGFPHDFLAAPASRNAIYGPLASRIDLPPAASARPGDGA